MFDNLLESSSKDDSNKLSNIEFGEEIKHFRTTENTHLILNPAIIPDTDVIKTWEQSWRVNLQRKNAGCTCFSSLLILFSW